MNVLPFLMTISLIGGMMVAGCTKKAVTSKVLEEELKAIPKEAVKVPVPEAPPVSEAPKVKPPEQVIKPEEPVERLVKPLEVEPKPEAPKVVPPEEAVKPKELVKPLEVEPTPEAPKVVPPVKEVAPRVEAKKEVTPVPMVKGLQDIFFDYDRFYIREDVRSILETDAEYLKANKDVGILIEGHCDERGTSEYNIALGERRAQATKRYLVDLGIDPSRLSTVSYGKEKPFCIAHNEGCWQENRRAHFVVK